MFKVCLFDFPKKNLIVENYYIESFDPVKYLSDSGYFSIRDLVAGGINGFDKRRAIIHAEGLDRLYRDRDPSYMRMMRDFVDQFQNFDLIVMSNYNFLHPEILYRELQKPIKILGFVDDPYSSYIRGIPYLWAFDGSFYISPSYDQHSLFDQVLERWGCKKSFWWPLTQDFNLPKRSEDFFYRREGDVIYIGNPTLTKVDRLIELKRHFGRQLRVHGRWRANGYYGLLRGLLGRPAYWGRVTSVTMKERSSLYYNTKIGFNMHVSDCPAETGNMRMYEVPAHGMLQICDKAARNAHELIFKPDKEAIYYDNLQDAIEKIEYYLAHDEERVEIAQSGYERMRRDYKWEDNLLKFLNWAVGIKDHNDER